MKYLRTHEGFISKIKKLIKGEEVLKKEIDLEDLEATLDECFLELKDDGFYIKIHSMKSNMYSSIHRKKEHHTGFGKERIIYGVDISKPMTVDFRDQLSMEDADNDSDWNIQEPKFTIGEIKDAVLVARDIIKSKFGIDVYLNDIEDESDDTMISLYGFNFDVPIQ